MANRRLDEFATEARRPGRAVDAVPAVQGHALPEGSRGPVQRLPGVRPPLHRLGPRPDRATRSTRTASRSGSPTCGRATRSASPTASRTHRQLEDEQKKTGLTDAAVVGKGFIRGRPVVARHHRLRVHGRQHGLGRRREADPGRSRRRPELSLPLIIVSGSGGGARMQEGILSLMQMAKVSAALARYDQAGGLYVSILTHPTMGGVAASWALQGDLTLAEPGAMIGFAGARTIWNTVRLELPEGFQTSEFLLEHGFVDRIVHRRDLRTEVARIIDYCEKQ